MTVNFKPELLQKRGQNRAAPRTPDQVTEGVSEHRVIPRRARNRISHARTGPVYVFGRRGEARKNKEVSSYAREDAPNQESHTRLLSRLQRRHFRNSRPALQIRSKRRSESSSEPLSKGSP